MGDIQRDVTPAPRAVGEAAAKAEKAKLLAVQDGISVRPYRPEDRPALERICSLTGLRGELDEIFCDRPLFVKFWLAPYLDGEPEHTVVAELDGKAVGYLVGNVRPHFARRSLPILFPYLVTMVFRWITGQYRHHPPSGRFVRWILTRSWRELPKTPPKSASFHFNLDPDMVSTMVGERLMAKFEEAVEAAGLPGWHAILFSSRKKRPVAMYKRMGFEIVDQVPNTLFPGGDVSTVCIYKPLTIWISMTRVPRKDTVVSEANESPEETN